MHKRYRLLLTGFIVFLVLLLTGLSFLLPVPLGEERGDTAFHAQLAVTLLYALATVGGAVLFIAGLRRFKSHFKMAYYFICLGIVTIGLSSLQFALFDYLNAWQSWWFDYKFMYLPNVIGALLIWLGVRRFGNLLGIKSRLFSSVYIILAIAATVLIAIPIPHVYVERIFEWQFDAIAVFVIAAPMILGFAAAAVFLIKSNISLAYHRGLAWFGWSLVINVVAMVQDLILNYAGHNNWYVDSRLIILPFLTAAILSIRAGYLFMKIGMSEETVSATSSPVDVIVYMAGLVSNPREIDVELDVLRQITATPGSGGQIDAKQEERLVQLYRQLEDYLVHHEPLRKFTTEDLRQVILGRFDISEKQNSPFWSLFTEPVTRSRPQ